MQVERLTRLSASYASADEIAMHIRADYPDMIMEASRMADAAALELEHFASIAIFNQSIRVTLPEWGDRERLVLPIAPYLDGAPLAIAIDANPVTSFAVIHGTRPSLRLTGVVPEGEVVVTYQAGFGDELAAVPRDLRHAIIDQAGLMFDMRSADLKGTGMSPHMARIAARYRRVGL
jgi:uncharacterized phiE125 gp8 family phage protein